MGAQEGKRTRIRSEPEHGHLVRVTALPGTTHRVHVAQSLCIEQAPGVPDTSAAPLYFLHLEDPEQKGLPRAFSSPTYTWILKPQLIRTKLYNLGHIHGGEVYLPASPMRRRCMWAAFSSYSWAPHHLHRVPQDPRAGTGGTLLPLCLSPVLLENGEI